MSATVDEAKIAVSGHTDEALYKQTAADTLRVLRETVGVRPDDTILEIGAGVGRVGAALAPFCREWIGADVSRHMLAHIRERLAAFPNVRTVPLTGYDLSGVESGSVDLVYATVVFMHLDEWERYAYVREGFRVLKPGGRMLVDNVNLLSETGWRMFEGLSRIPPAERVPQISKVSTPQELEAYFRRAGFGGILQRCDDLWLFTYGTKPSS